MNIPFCYVTCQGEDPEHEYGCSMLDMDSLFDTFYKTRELEYTEDKNATHPVFPQLHLTLGQLVIVCKDKEAAERTNGKFRSINRRRKYA